MENALLINNQNELSIKESNFHESDNNTSITMSMSISMEGQAKRKKEERIKSLKLAKEFPKIEKITHNTSDRNFNEPHENSDIHFINMINFKNFIQANFDKKISEFEKFSNSQEKEIIDVMFLLHSLKGEIESMNNSLGEFLQTSQIQITKHTRTLTSKRPDEFLNQSNHINNTLNSSRRSFSSTNKSKFGVMDNSTRKNELDNDKFKMFSPKVFINIAPLVNINESKKNFTSKIVSSETKSNLNNKLNINNPITEKIMNYNKTNQSTKNYTINNQDKSNQTTPKKNENNPKQNMNHYNSLKLPTKDDLNPLNKKLLSSGSHKNSNKAISNTSNNAVNKFLSKNNERKSSNKISTEQIKKTAYKLAPKKKSDFSKENMMSVNNSNPIEITNQKSSLMMPVRKLQNNSEVMLNEKISLSFPSNNLINRENINQNSNKNDFDGKSQIESELLKLRNIKNSKQIFSLIFSFLTVKNKLKNMNKFFRQNFIEFQVRRIEYLIAEQNKNIEDAKGERKSNLLELILEMEILSHRESKLKTILNHNLEFYN